MASAFMIHLNKSELMAQAFSCSDVFLTIDKKLVYKLGFPILLGSFVLYVSWYG